MLADGTRDILKDRSHVDTYLEMEQLLKTGKVKAIGVANYSVKYLEDLLQRASVVPAVNQIENHPQCPQQDIVDYCRQKGIHVTAYSPLGSSGSPLMSFPDVVEVADKYGVSPACVLLSYHGQCLILLISRLQHSAYSRVVFTNYYQCNAVALS